jgi:hypothetical protein
MAPLFSLLSGTEDSAVQSQAMISGLDLVHAVADGIIAVSLFVIPAALFFVFYRRGERSRTDQALLALFILFLSTTGLAHFASALFGPGRSG